MANKIQLLVFTLFCSLYVHSQSLITLVDSSSTKFRDDIILDEFGNLYCADYGGTNIYKRTPQGAISIFASGFNTPNGLAFDSSNNLFVCDNIGDRIYKLDFAGNFLDTFIIDNPSGLIKDLYSDTMIFTNYGTAHTLGKLAPDGTLSITHSGMGLNGPVGLEYDDAGQLYVANFNDRKIFRVLPGTLDYLATLPGPTNSALGFLAYGGGYLWATNFGDHKIYGVSISTTDSTFLLVGSTAGGNDGALSVATLNSPNGIYANQSADTIYITEYNTGKLRIIRPDFASLDNRSDVQNQKLVLSPNPASPYAHVTADYKGSFEQVVVTNYLGQIVENYNFNELTKQFMFYSSGQYIIYFKNGVKVISETIFVQ